MLGTLGWSVEFFCSGVIPSIHDGAPAACGSCAPSVGAWAGGVAAGTGVGAVVAAGGGAWAKTGDVPLTVCRPSQAMPTANAPQPICRNAIVSSQDTERSLVALY